MALSYGLTNPAAFKKGGGSEPTIIGYKLYKLQYKKVWESNDFGSFLFLISCITNI